VHITLRDATAPYTKPLHQTKKHPFMGVFFYCKKEFLSIDQKEVMIVYVDSEGKIHHFNIQCGLSPF